MRNFDRLTESTRVLAQFLCKLHDCEEGLCPHELCDEKYPTTCVDIWQEWLEQEFSETDSYLCELTEKG